MSLPGFIPSSALSPPTIWQVSPQTAAVPVEFSLSTSRPPAFYIIALSRIIYCPLSTSPLVPKVAASAPTSLLFESQPIFSVSLPTTELLLPAFTLLLKLLPL